MQNIVCSNVLRCRQTDLHRGNIPFIPPFDNIQEAWLGQDLKEENKPLYTKKATNIGSRHCYVVRFPPRIGTGTMAGWSQDIAGVSVSA